MKKILRGCEKESDKTLLRLYSGGRKKKLPDVSQGNHYKLKRK